jgi:peptidyl-prolyl cis-trans isomerase D
MATLQKLRDKSGMLLAIVIFVALAAFILGDMFQSGGSIIRGQQMKIAEIDGQNIEYPNFKPVSTKIANIYKSNNNINNLDEEAYNRY